MKTSSSPMNAATHTLNLFNIKITLILIVIFNFISFVPEMNSQSTDQFFMFNLTVLNGSGSGFYRPGQDISIEAYPPRIGYSFDTWQGASCFEPLSGKTHLIMPNHDVSMEAIYKKNLYHLTVKNGTGSADLNYEQIHFIEADLAATGYMFDKWIGDPVKDPTAIQTQIVMPARNAEVTATFKKRSFHLIVKNGTGSGDILFEDTQNIQADKAANGYIFDKWTGDSVKDASAEFTQIIMPARDAEVIATYKIFLSVNDTVSAKEMFISENPVKELLNIYLPDSKNEQVKNENINIYNSLGDRIITLEQVQSSLNAIKVSGLVSGVYFIRFRNQIRMFVKID
ncbi:MAG: T9SS type A sorting domain-containing protein [Candidatus Kapabacteria bacterium]|nr:T9SS type A sorting domain-containing protein [Candidatus Kapabacteria bacterium]